MSGYKVSEFSIQRELQRKLSMINKMQSTVSELQELNKQIERVLEKASEGLKATFSDDVLKATTLLDQKVPDTKDLDMRAANNVLENMNSGLQQNLKARRDCLKTLSVAFTSKADEIGRQITSNLANTNEKYIEKITIIGLWHKNHVQSLEGQMQTIHKMINEEQYASAKTELTNIEANIHRYAEEAEALEAKHQKRLYVLRSLRDVCADCGFKEIEEPKRETEADRGSRILFSVDTRGRGRIDFALSLDEINSSSGIRSDHCYDEYDKVSAGLKDLFGISTEFHPKDAERPKLKEMDQKELPRTQDTGLEA